MSEEDLSIDSTLRKLQFLFTLSGLNVENKKHNYKQKFIVFFNLFWLNRDVAGAIYLLIEEIINGNDFVHITYNAPCITYSNMSNIKFLSIFFSARKVHELICILKDLERSGLQRGMTAEKENVIIRQERSFLHRLLQVLNGAYSVLIFGFAVNPVSITIYKYVRYNEVVLMLPFLVKYPFDAYDINYWPWVYIHQLGSEIVVIGNVMMVDYLFYTLCTYIRIQFRLLQHDIECLITDTKSKSLKEIEQKFRDLVQWHIECIRAASMLDAVYSKATLCNFVSSSILICLTGFDVMVISDVMMVVTFMSFLGTSLLQIFFLCFFGDLLMKSSMEVGDAVYRSQWYLKDADVGRNLLLVLIRSQRACKLTAYKFGDVNLRAFMRILSNAWSYFALLNTIYG